MSRRVLRLEIPVFPERMMFRVQDPIADPDSPGAPLPPVENLISTSRDQLIVACAQEHLGVQLTIEEWDDAPPPFSDGYEDEAKCVLYLRGQLTVDMGKSGRAVDGLRLSGGVGDYGVRIYTRNRAAALQSYSELFNQDADPLSDEFQQARKQLEGMEQYLLQLWRES
ncbi:MAG TPA: hypothetical protein VK823_21895 [Streptosporangiaceae bacterium]|nr:hypothetical protein [Streptosporangiaceae bacterium]